MLLGHRVQGFQSCFRPLKTYTGSLGRLGGIKIKAKAGKNRTIHCFLEKPDQLDWIDCTSNES
jgi:hypothetical protein